MNYGASVKDEKFLLDDDSSSRKSLSSIGIERFEYFKEDSNEADATTKTNDGVSTEKSFSSHVTPQVSMDAKLNSLNEVAAATPGSSKVKLRGLLKFKKRGSSFKEKLTPKCQHIYTSPNITTKGDDDMKKILGEYRANQLCDRKKSSVDRFRDFDSHFHTDVPATIQRCLTISHHHEQKSDTEILDNTEIYLGVAPKTLDAPPTAKTKKMMDKLFGRFKSPLFRTRSKSSKKSCQPNSNENNGDLSMF